MSKCKLVAALLLFGVLGCSQQPPQPQFAAEDETAIRTLFDQWAANIAQNNTLANAELHGENAAELLGSPRVGRDEIRTRWEGFVDRYDYSEVNIEVRELLGFGDHAFAWVQLEMRFLYDGDPRMQNGTWTVLLQRGAEGEWTIHRSAWMMNAFSVDSTVTASSSDAGG